MDVRACFGRDQVDDAAYMLLADNEFIVLVS